MILEVKIPKNYPSFWPLNFRLQKRSRSTLTKQKSKVNTGDMAKRRQKVKEVLMLRQKIEFMKRHNQSKKTVVPIVHLSEEEDDECPFDRLEQMEKEKAQKETKQGSDDDDDDDCPFERLEQMERDKKKIETERIAEKIGDVDTTQEETLDDY